MKTLIIAALLGNLSESQAISLQKTQNIKL